MEDHPMQRREDLFEQQMLSADLELTDFLSLPLGELTRKYLEKHLTKKKSGSTSERKWKRSEPFPENSSNFTSVRERKRAIKEAG